MVRRERRPTRMPVAARTAPGRDPRTRPGRSAVAKRHLLVGVRLLTGVTGLSWPPDNTMLCAEVTSAANAARRAAQAAGLGRVESCRTRLDSRVNRDRNSPPPERCECVGTRLRPPINLNVAFSVAVTGFTGSDVTFAATAPESLTAAFTGIGATYNVAVSVKSGGGVVRASIPAKCRRRANSRRPRWTTLWRSVRCKAGFESRRDCAGKTSVRPAPFAAGLQEGGQNRRSVPPRTPTTTCGIYAAAEADLARDPGRGPRTENSRRGVEQFGGIAHLGGRRDRKAGCGRPNFASPQSLAR